MIEGIEISPSGRAKCNGGCGRIIGNGTPRGISSENTNYGTSYRYYCYKCTKNKLNEQIKISKELLEKLDKEVKSHKKEITQMDKEDMLKELAK